ncbi:hypothetical protein K1719_019358 [Acacia pycnantha]|nr:hypothetical protein K1719_019358 [Acacia pycnantha]
MGIPFSWFLLKVIPQSVNSFAMFAILERVRDDMRESVSSTALFGLTVESFSGPRTYLALYFVSAIASSAMSYWFCRMPSIGASGAIALLYALGLFRSRGGEYIVNDVRFTVNQAVEPVEKGITRFNVKLHT